MSDTGSRFKLLSNNALKIIACILMVIDHTGMMIFPDATFLRIIGRIGFPIFAYLIAEGARHTKNKLRHVLTMAGFGIAMQTVYFFVSESLEMNVLITFTLSLLIIYSLDYVKACFFDESKRTHNRVISSLLFLGSLCLAVSASHLLDLDYGLAGCILPVFPSLFNTPKIKEPPRRIQNV